MRGIGVILAFTCACGLLAPAEAPAQTEKNTPYFASIAAGRARMRTGPGRTYPTIWLYVRADLPVRVLTVYKEWRKVEDPGGARGWMLGNLLSEARTGFVWGEIAELRERPVADAKLLWRAAPGVVGRLSECADGWCRLDVRGRSGYVETSRLWGVGAGERLP